MIPLLNSRQLDEGREKDNGESKCSDNENDDNLESISQIVSSQKAIPFYIGKINIFLVKRYSFLVKEVNGESWDQEHAGGRDAGAHGHRHGRHDAHVGDEQEGGDDGGPDGHGHVGRRIV